MISMNKTEQHVIAWTSYHCRGTGSLDDGRERGRGREEGKRRGGGEAEGGGREEDGVDG